MTFFFIKLFGPNFDKIRSTTRGQNVPFFAQTDKLVSINPLEIDYGINNATYKFRDIAGNGAKGELIFANWSSASSAFLFRMKFVDSIGAALKVKSVNSFVVKPDANNGAHNIPSKVDLQGVLGITNPALDAIYENAGNLTTAAKNIIDTNTDLAGRKNMIVLAVELKDSAEGDVTGDIGIQFQYKDDVSTRFFYMGEEGLDLENEDEYTPEYVGEFEQEENSDFGNEDDLMMQENASFSECNSEKFKFHFKNKTTEVNIEFPICSDKESLNMGYKANFTSEDFSRTTPFSPFTPSFTLKVKAGEAVAAFGSFDVSKITDPAQKAILSSMSKSLVYVQKAGVSVYSEIDTSGVALTVDNTIISTEALADLNKGKPPVEPEKPVTPTGCTLGETVNLETIKTYIKCLTSDKNGKNSTIIDEIKANDGFIEGEFKFTPSSRTEIEKKYLFFKVKSSQANLQATINTALTGKSFYCHTDDNWKDASNNKFFLITDDADKAAFDTADLFSTYLLSIASEFVKSTVEANSEIFQAVVDASTDKCNNNLGKLHKIIQAFEKSVYGSSFLTVDKMVIDAAIKVAYEAQDEDIDVSPVNETEAQDADEDLTNTLESEDSSEIAVIENEPKAPSTSTFSFSFTESIGSGEDINFGKGIFDTSDFTADSFINLIVKYCEAYSLTNATDGVVVEATQMQQYKVTCKK